MRRSVVLALVLPFAWASCHQSPAPERVLETYFDHLRAGRIPQAYALTSVGYRAGHDLTAFALAAARQPTIDRRTVRRGEATLRVELSTPGARTVVLRGPRDERLRLDEDPLYFYDVRSPLAALQSFARAVRCKRPARAAELLGHALAQRWSLATREEDDPFPGDVQRLAAALEDELNRPAGLRLSSLNEGETEARLELTNGDVLVLSRTGSGWHLTDLP